MELKGALETCEIGELFLVYRSELSVMNNELKVKAGQAHTNREALTHTGTDTQMQTHTHTQAQTYRDT